MINKTIYGLTVIKTKNSIILMIPINKHDFLDTFTTSHIYTFYIIPPGMKYFGEGIPD